MPSYRKTQIKFVNPYNFVGIAERCVRGRDFAASKRDTDAISGWLECTLELKSPIFIPNSSNDDYFLKRRENQDKKDGPKSYEFYSYQDLSGKDYRESKALEHPVIPGSELKGMIRSAFEALTNSCLSTVDIDQYFHKRAPKSQQTGLPGLLVRENDHWVIVKCDRYMLKTYMCDSDPFRLNRPPQEWKEHLRALERDHKPVWIKPGSNYKGRSYMAETVTEISENPSNDNCQGYVHITARFGSRKHHDSVFIPTNRKFPVSDEAVQNYIRNLDQYRSNDEYREEYRHLYRGDDPSSYDKSCVFYSEYKQAQKSYFYLSPSMISREVYYNNINNLHPSHAPCDNRKDLCPACDLFGMISEKGSAASKLRFTDATLSQDCIPEWDEPCWLDELAGPKPSATEFYVKKPGNAHIWTYDYSYKWEMRDRRPTNTVVDINLASNPIRGRKFYWHSPDGSYKTANLDALRHEERESKMKRLCFARPLRIGSFTFKVFFNRVRETDINRLIWVLSIGMSDEHGHKIGMGKPLGLGSVQIRVQRRIKRVVNEQLQSVLFTADYVENASNRKTIIEKNAKSLGCTDTILAQFKEITKLKHGYKLAYPYVVKRGTPQPEYYKWFVANKQINGKANSPIIERCLPEPRQPELEVYEEFDQQR